MADSAKKEKSAKPAKTAKCALKAVGCGCLCFDGGWSHYCGTGLLYAVRRGYLNQSVERG